MTGKPVACIHCYFEFPREEMVLGQICLHCSADSLLGLIDFTKHRFMKPLEFVTALDTQPGPSRPIANIPSELREALNAKPVRSATDFSSTRPLHRNMAAGELAGMDVGPEHTHRRLSLYIRPLPEDHDIELVDFGSANPDCSCAFSRVAKLNLGDVDPTAKICVDCGKVWSEMPDDEREERAARPSMREVVRGHLRPTMDCLFGKEREAAIYKGLAKVMHERIEPYLARSEELSEDAIESVYALVNEAKHTETQKEKYDVLRDLFNAFVAVFAEKEDWRHKPVDPKDLGEPGPGPVLPVDTYTTAERRLMKKAMGIHPVYAALNANTIYVTEVGGMQARKKRPDEEDFPKATIQINFSTVDPNDKEAKKKELEQGHYDGVKGFFRYYVPDDAYLKTSAAWSKLLKKPLKFEYKGTTGFTEDPVTKQEVPVEIDCAAQGKFFESLAPTVAETSQFIAMQQALDKIVGAHSHEALHVGTFKQGDIWYDAEEEVWREVGAFVGQEIPQTTKTIFARPLLPFGGAKLSKEKELLGTN